MIRSLTSLPISILALIFIFIYADWSMLANVIFSFLFITAYSGQVLYNFFMWKKVEANLRNILSIIGVQQKGRSCVKLAALHSGQT